MPKDIRDILKEAQRSKELQENHRARFEKRLDRMHSAKRSNFFFLKIAASILIVVGLGTVIFNMGGSAIETPDAGAELVDIKSVSPEMKQIEDYYLAAINYEIASLEITPENQTILDTYLDKIGKLTDDYARLNNEIAVNGINEKTVNAMITNLQLRLELLLQLKDTLNEMKTSKNIENEGTTI